MHERFAWRGFEDDRIAAIARSMGASIMIGPRRRKATAEAIGLFDA
jgi:hypothetical protein